MHNKDSLRQLAFSARLQMSLAEKERASAAMTENFLKNVHLPKDAIVSAFWPVRGEIDVRDLIRRLAREGYQCALPRVIENMSLLDFRRWDEETPMLTSLYGVEEPDPAVAELVIPDIYIMPLLAADKEGHRLGYGAGYYDRTFDHFRPIKPVFLIGVAFQDQIYDHVPFEAHDWPLDMLVTDQNVYKFKGRNS